jgi:hypothetical protein
MAETHFDEWIATRYETLWPELFDPAVMGPAVDFLGELTATGPALEFGIGTGAYRHTGEPSERARARDRVVPRDGDAVARTAGRLRHRRDHR